MASMRRLDKRILRRILWYFYNNTRHYHNGIEVFRQLLPVMKVCRKWRELLAPAAYKTAYLEQSCKRNIPKLEKKKSHSFKGVFGKRHKIKQYEGGWASNIELIASLKQNYGVERLEIAFNSQSTSAVDIPNVLDMFRFNRAYWPLIIKLTIKEQQHIAIGTTHLIKNDQSRTISKSVDYFAERIPNAQQLIIDLCEDSQTNREFLYRMIYRYWKNLRLLDSGTHIPPLFIAPRFRRCLTHLTLTMDQRSKGIIPNVVAPQLSYLELRGMPKSFVWHSFVTAIDGTMSFGSLQKLKLYYQCSCPMEDVNSSRPMLFPGLQTLEVWNNPYTSDTFYDVFANSPLKRVLVSGPFGSIQHFNASMLSNLIELTICITRIPADKSDKYTLFTDKLFSCASAVQEASVVVLHSSNIGLSIPDKIGWTDIRKLSIVTSICLSSVVKLFYGCPRLEQLIVQDMEDDLGDEATPHSVLANGIEHKKHGKSRYPTFGLLNNVSSTKAHSIIRLIELVPSLSCLLIPKHLTGEVEEFIARHSSTFQSPKNIRVFSLK